MLSLITCVDMTKRYSNNVKKTLRQKIARVSYKTIAKPLMFRFSPDMVHARMVRVSGGVAKSPSTLKLGKKWFSYRPSGTLEQDVAGLHFVSPIGIAAGLDKNAEMMHVAQMIGCGFTTVGSVTYEPRTGNKRPWFHRLPRTKSIVVNAGMPNRGIKNIGQRLKNRPRAFPVFVSVAVVAATPETTDAQVIDDALRAVAYLDEHRLCEAIEVNISCPNIRDKEFFTRPDRLDALLKRIDALKLTLPLFLKMPNSPEWSPYEVMLDVILHHNVQGVTIANLVKERVSVDLHDPLPETVRGGLSGMPTQAQATELIRRTRIKCGDKLVIIGLGGIFNAKDAYEKLDAGANLIEMATGLIFEGPQVVNEINAELETMLRAQGLSSVRDIHQQGTTDYIFTENR